MKRTARANRRRKAKATKRLKAWRVARWVARARALTAVLRGNAQAMHELSGSFAYAAAAVRGFNAAQVTP